MVLRTAVALAALAAAGPAFAEPLSADAARRFVVGKVFSFTCFEGTAGSGRIFNDGSVAGVVKIQGSGPTRFMHLPPGTLFSKGETVCSSMKGAFFNPCFKLDRTSDKSFRGAISGFGFAYCDFMRGGREPVRTASTTETDPAAPPRRSIRHGKPRGETVSAAPSVSAAPTQAVTSEPLKPAVEQPAIRSTIAP
jgi:hypothetical protein